MSSTVQAVAPDDRLAAAAAIMLARSVPALAVVQSGRLVGTVSERDVLRAVARGLSTDALCVRDCMTPAHRTSG